ncbi:hypothetical protein D3C79_915720 [compost metagenome]
MVISVPARFTASWLSCSRNLGIWRLRATFGVGVSKAMPPAIRVCSDSLFILMPDRPPVRVMPLTFQKREEPLTRFSYSFSMCTPIRMRLLLRANW